MGASDARRIVQQASGYDGAELQVHLSDAPSVLAHRRCADMVERRAGGEPLQYVLGCWGFRTLDLFVDRRVLIPRPETETVVEVVLAEVDRVDARLVVDLGTGSGAIALAVAAERPRVEVWGTDRSAGAIDVARANLAGLGRAGARVRLVQGTWYDALPSELAGRTDVVVSNPPYVAAEEALPEDVAMWEPREALIAGSSGLEAIEAIVRGAPGWLGPTGALVVEIAPHQAETASRLACDAGFAGADVRPDLAGRARVLVARR